MSKKTKWLFGKTVSNWFWSEVFRLGTVVQIHESKTHTHRWKKKNEKTWKASWNGHLSLEFLILTSHPNPHPVSVNLSASHFSLMPAGNDFPNLLNAYLCGNICMYVCNLDMEIKIYSCLNQLIYPERKFEIIYVWCRRGLAAARDLRKGELILRVPKSALMTRESLMRDEKLSVAVNKYPSLSSTQVCIG